MARRKRESGKRQLPSPVGVPGSSAQPKKAVETQALLPWNDSGSWRRWATFGALLVLAGIYCYWPTLVWMEETWRREADYSHGYIVPILALMLLRHRSESFPGVHPKSCYAGLGLIGLAVGMRIVGRLLYMDFLDAYSLLPMILGSVWVLFGRSAAWWSVPAIGFLFFMFPLPFRAETLLSWKLQGVATSLSTTMLRVLGQPAVSEGHVIWIGEQQLLVEQACSGMRIFVGAAALAYYWAAKSTRSWTDKAVLIASFIPIAILVNAARITVVGLLVPYFSSHASHVAIHDWSGLLMIPVAFLLLGGVKRYWEIVFRPVEQMTAKDFLNKKDLSVPAV